MVPLQLCETFRVWLRLHLFHSENHVSGDEMTFITLGEEAAVHLVLEISGCFVGYNHTAWQYLL